MEQSETVAELCIYIFITEVVNILIELYMKLTEFREIKEGACKGTGS
jgi:hypothetical protein